MIIEMLKEFIQVLIIASNDKYLYLYLYLHFRLPNLLHILIKNVNISSITQSTHNNVKYSLIKVLINTFNLSAGNIVVLSREEKLVGLILIKM